MCMVQVCRCNDSCFQGSVGGDYSNMLPQASKILLGKAK
jgi:hypothetical protein